MNDKKIDLLIIDDLPDNRKLLRMDLEDEIPEIHVDEADQGRVGLQMMAARDYTIVICDILMPEMDGFEVLQEARKNKQAEGTPFLFLSALRQPDTIKRGLELGAVDFLTKPYDIDELVYKVRNLARIKHLQDELKRSQHDLLEANKRLQTLNDEKNRVMQIVSHDLRSPLSGIKGLSKILYSQIDVNDHETVVDLARTIHDTSTSLTRLVNDLLNITRIESTHETDLNCTDCKLSDLIMQSVATFEKLADAKGVAIGWSCGPEAYVRVDEPKLLQVLNNLIANSVKFTEPEGHITVEVVMPREDEKHLKIIVQDTGIGIPLDFKPYLFQKFGKHQRLGTDGEKGVGLGLPIVKCFTELHGGSVDIQSEEGAGTTATIALPASLIISAPS